MAAIGGARSSERQFLRHLHVERWQLALILLSAAVLTLIFMAIFVIPTVRIIAHRVGEHAIQNPTEFVPISSKMVEFNGGLREAISCADSRYEILANSGGGYGMGIDSGCDMKISWYDFELIKSEIPRSQEGNFFRIEHDGKYYGILMLYA